MTRFLAIIALLRDLGLRWLLLINFLAFCDNIFMEVIQSFVIFIDFLNNHQKYQLQWLHEDGIVV